MATETERKHLISSIRSLRTMERLQCSPEACAATGQIVEANIDALIEAAKREGARDEAVRMAALKAEVASLESDPKMGGEA